jgi:hypothetical protein
MTAIARMTALDLRTVTPYRYQSLLAFGAAVLLFSAKPVWLLPGLVLIFTTQVAPYPFRVADKAGLETLYAVLPVPRRSVLYGHYAWAVALFLATATAGTALALILARAQSVPFSGRTLVTMLVLSWALFAVNIAVQFPLIIRFGYTQSSVLGTTLPLAVIVASIYKTHLSIASMQNWIVLIGVVGVAAIVASVTVATTADRRRVRYGGPVPADRTGLDK